MFIASRLSTHVSAINLSNALLCYQHPPDYQLLSTSARIINLYNVRRTINVPPGLTANLEIRIFFVQNVGDPEATDVVGQGFGGHEAQAVLFAYMFKFYRSTHTENYKNYRFFEINDCIVLVSWLNSYQS